MDRFEDKAREICERISRDRAAFIAGATEALTAAILRAAVEMGKPEPVEQPAPRSPDLMARMAEALRRLHAIAHPEPVDAPRCPYVALLAEYDATTKEPTNV